MPIDYANIPMTLEHRDAVTAAASPRPWRAVPSGRVGTDCLFDANGTYIGTVPKIDSALIVEAVNLKARIDEAMADESGYLHPVALDGKPVVCVTPPPSEAEESRMHREYETSLLVDRERFRRCYYKAEERNDRLRDIVRRLYQMCCEDWVHTNAEGRDLLREARAAIGEDA